ncbi:BlaR1 peptidase M56 [Clostridium oryzae]|uniref:BlaR1 peptidase M56 n=1 Tax=Clostridium oryzae TaxID=1450648 RepID=A0A1V4IWT4_9CLOT|nr:BlaR1 peptidase M56 [Clostridium oryzae]
MDNFLIIFIKNSIVMSAIIVLYLIFTRLFFRGYIAKLRYYSWLIVLFGLIIPFRPKISNEGY